MEKVIHNKYGIGTIISKRFGGFEFKIKFENGLERWIRADQLESYEKIIEDYHFADNVQVPKNRFIARQTIESLRMGIVPYQAIEHFTVGRESEIKKINNWLNNKSKGSLFLTGEYGSGKTHLLEYIKLAALNDGWAISFVEVGLEENPFYKPYQIYQQIIQSFSAMVNGNKINFQAFINLIINNDKFDQLPRNNYFHTLKFLLEAESDNKDKIWEWIEGIYDWYKPKLYKQGTSANIYCNLINFISHTAKEIANLKGFLILFDEAEYINESNYRYQLEKGKNFRNGILKVAQNDKKLLTEKITKLEKYGRYGRKTGLQYSGLPRNEPIRFAWHLPSHLKVIFAMTPSEKEDFNILEISNLKQKYFFIIARNIVDYYQNAYEINLEKFDIAFIVSKLKKTKIRLFIKQVIEILDIIRFNPEKLVKEFLK